MSYEYKLNTFPLTSPLGEAFQRREEARAAIYPIVQQLADIRNALQVKGGEHFRLSRAPTQTRETRKRMDDLRAECKALTEECELLEKEIRALNKDVEDADISYNQLLEQWRTNPSLSLPRESARVGQ